MNAVSPKIKLDEFNTHIEFNGLQLIDCGFVIALDKDNANDGGKYLKPRILRNGDHVCDYLKINFKRKIAVFIEKKDLSKLFLLEEYYSKNIKDLVETLDLQKQFKSKNITTKKLPLQEQFENHKKDLINNLELKAKGLAYILLFLTRNKNIPKDRNFKNHFIFVVEGTIKNNKLFNEIENRLISTLNDRSIDEFHMVYASDFQKNFKKYLCID